MSRVPDRAKLRREYLRKKGKAFTLRVLGALLFFPALCMTSILGMWSVLGFLGGEADALYWLFGGGSATLTGIALTTWFWRLMDDTPRASRIRYVPPFTPDALPAREILVRSAEEPAILHSKYLLRTVASEEAREEADLLRSSQMQPMEERRRAAVVR